MAILFHLPAQGGWVKDPIAVDALLPVSCNETEIVGLTTELSSILVTLAVTDTVTMGAAEASPLPIGFPSTADSLLLAVNDATPALLAGLSASDTCAYVAVELSAANVFQNSFDTLVVQASDAATSTATLTASETGVVQGVDNAQSPIAIISTTDTCVFQTYSELITFGDRTLFYGDSLAIQAAEQWRTVSGTEIAGTGVGFTHWEVTDPLALSVTDSATSGFDLLKLQLDDSSTPVIQIAFGVTDICAYVIVEPIAPSIFTNTFDLFTTQLSDTVTSIVIAISASDSLAVQASESPASIASTVSISESAAVQVSEAVVIASTVSMVDSAGVTGNDVVAISVVGSTTESLLVQLTELPAVFATNLTVDNCTIFASDAMPGVVQSASVSSSDSCAIQASELTPLIGQAFQVVESLFLQASESVQPGPQVLSANESLTTQITEAQTSLLSTLASDLAQVIAQDNVPRINAAASATDAISLPISEVATQQVVNTSTPITASDSCALPMTDEIEPGLALFASDTCELPIEEMSASPAIPAEEVALLLLEQARLDITEMEVIWGGGTRYDDVGSYLYAGSYRMGPRFADETRGSEY